MSKNLKYILCYAVLVIGTFSFVFWKVDYNIKNSTNYNITIVLRCKKQDISVLWKRTQASEFHKDHRETRTCNGHMNNNILHYEVPFDTPIVRWNYSRNQAQNKIVIEEILVKKNQEKKILKGKDILSFFKPNRYIKQHTLENGNLVLLPKAINGKYAPFFHELDLGTLF